MPHLQLATGARRMITDEEIDRFGLPRIRKNDRYNDTYLLHLLDVKEKVDISEHSWLLCAQSSSYYL